MALYQETCLGEAARDAVQGGAGVARTHGARCDALARAIQGLDDDARRAGSADLARPDFYTPGSQ